MASERGIGVFFYLLRNRW